MSHAIHIPVCGDYYSYTYGLPVEAVGGVMPVALKYFKHLTYGEGQPAGMWCKSTRDGKETARMSCPKCSGVASLDKHEVAAQGQVHPSVVCPFRGCDFHDYVLLEGWEKTDG